MRKYDCFSYEQSRDVNFRCILATTIDWKRMHKIYYNPKTCSLANDTLLPSVFELDILNNMSELLDVCEFYKRRQHASACESRYSKRMQQLTVFSVNKTFLNYSNMNL